LLVSVGGLLFLAGNGLFPFPLLIVVFAATIALSWVAAPWGKWRGITQYRRPDPIMPLLPLRLRVLLTAVIILGCIPAVKVVAPLVYALVTDRSREHSPAREERWYERDGHYFHELNDDDPQELTKAQFVDAVRPIEAIFLGAAAAMAAYAIGCIVVKDGRRKD
jgi:hypothetical protein